LRVENFGSRFALTIIDVLATNPPSGSGPGIAGAIYERID
jgi:hypothetical protein